jgi:hypothetical protein
VCLLRDGSASMMFFIAFGIQQEKLPYDERDSSPYRRGFRVNERGGCAMSVSAPSRSKSDSRHFLRRSRLDVPYDSASIENGYSPVKVRNHS